jgi:hypothetical protein
VIDAIAGLKQIPEAEFKNATDVRVGATSRLATARKHIVRQSNLYVGSRAAVGRMAAATPRQRRDR